MALVPIPTNRTLDGVSPPGELNTRQFIDERALPRLQAFADAFYARFGRNLVVTEGARSRARQDFLWNAYQAYLRRGKRPPWAALAARPYNSIHDAVTRGNAVDLGSNVSKARSPESVWAHANGPRFGVRFTVRSEAWHADIDTGGFAGGGTPIGEDDMPSLEEIHHLIKLEAGSVIDQLRGSIPTAQDNQRAVWGATWSRDGNPVSAGSLQIRAAEAAIDGRDAAVRAGTFILYNTDITDDEIRRAIVTPTTFRVVGAAESTVLRKVNPIINVNLTEWDVFRSTRTTL